MRIDTMQVNTLGVLKFLSGWLATVTAVSVLTLLPMTATDVFQSSAVAQRAGADDEDGPRPPPSTRQANTLSRAVYTRIEDAQELRDLERFDEAFAKLGELEEMHRNGRLNNYETYMMRIFYASFHMEQENFAESAGYWQQALEVPELTPDQMGQALQPLAQLRFMLEDFRGSIDAYMEYLRVVEDPNNSAYLRMGTAYYILEEYEEAIPLVLRNIELERAAGNEIPESTYSLLLSLHITLEDFVAARLVLREMVVLFDKPDSWVQLAQVESQLENFEAQTHTYYMADLKEYISSGSQMMNLGFLVYNMDNAWNAASIVSQGMAEGTIEEDSDNLAFLSLFYQIAREDALAVPPLERAADMADDGELYYRLARLFMNMYDFENAIEAMDNALAARGEPVNRPDQLNLTKANAYWQLNRHDEAIAAAREAARDDRSSDNAQNWIEAIQRDKQRYETLQRQRRELAEYF